MPKLIVVENDKVEGKDTHNVAGTATPPAAPPPTVPFSGTGDFDYKGKMTGALSDFVKIDGTPVALTSSKSSLDPGETAPGGGHSGLGGKNYQPAAPNTPTPATMNLTDPVGEGKPSATAGSTFVTVGSTPVLLDADKLDTCGAASAPMNSTVTAGGQGFVNCSE